jgi:ribosomal protein S18 acetylase RimI-like enzyme
VTPPFAIEPLGPGHDRSGFDCGVHVLNHYFQRQAGQDQRRRVSACFVATHLETGRVAAFYTLAAGSIPLDAIPAELSRRLPRYPVVPVALLGRLAVDRGFQGRRLGGALLWDALMRAGRSEVAVFALVVDAKDDAAAGFYRHHGFSRLERSGRRLVRPLGPLRQGPVGGSEC